MILNVYHAFVFLVFDGLVSPSVNDRACLVHQVLKSQQPSRVCLQEKVHETTCQVEFYGL